MHVAGIRSRVPARLEGLNVIRERTIGSVDVLSIIESARTPRDGIFASHGIANRPSPNGRSITELIGLQCFFSNKHWKLFKFTLPLRFRANICCLAFIGLYSGESEAEGRRLGGVLCPGRPPGQKM